MEITRLVVGQMKVNCYLCFDTVSLEGIVVDPGDDAEFVYQKIQELNLKVSLIVATHGHFDHLMAVNELKANLAVPFAMNLADSFLLKRFRGSAKHFLGIDPGPAPKVDENLPNKVSVSSQEFEIISVPGHTPGSVTLYNKSDNFVIVGDVLFAEGGVGRTDFEYSDKEVLNHSIALLRNLPKNTIFYPGHGDEFKLS